MITNMKILGKSSRWIACALLLGLLCLAGCGGEKRLGVELDTERWASVQAAERFDRPGQVGASLAAGRLDLDELRARLAETTAQKGEKTGHMPIPCVQLYLQDETGIAVLLYVGRDGSVQVGSDTGDAILYSYWDTESDALYEWLLSALDS